MKNRMEVEAQRKDRKKQEEEATEGLKRFRTQEMARESEEVLHGGTGPEVEGTERLQELLQGADGSHLCSGKYGYHPDASIALSA